MKILVTKEFPGESLDTIILSQGSWDDYGNKTTFKATYIDEIGTHHLLGIVKITSLGFEGGYITLPPQLNNGLPENFCSLGQSQSYYETIKSLKDEKIYDVLKSLNDVVEDRERFLRFRNDSSFRTSLLRELDASRIEIFRTIIHGALRAKKYDFSYESRDGVSMNFSVNPDAMLPSNLQAIIGRNGVGKTTLLSTMAYAACQADKAPDGAFIFRQREAGEGTFGNVIAISFSAFDKFSVPNSDGSDARDIRYDYVGLRVIGENRLRNRDEITEELLNSLEQCLFSARKPLWLKAINILCNDPIFSRLPVAKLGSLTEPSQLPEYNRIIESMSSGHQIVLLTITKLVQLVENRTLVLYDEPECHLHPPLVASLMRAVSEVLKERNGVAILTTHSPVVLQEIPCNCAWTYDIVGEKHVAAPIGIETFAENIGTLTQHIFGLELKESSYYRLINEVVESGRVFTIDDVSNQFGTHLGGEGRLVAAALLSVKNPS